MKSFLVFLSLTAFVAAGPASSGVYVQYLGNRRVQCRENCRRANRNDINSLNNCAVVNCPPAVRNGCAPPDCSLAGNILRLHPHNDPNRYWQCQRTDDYGGAVAIERHCACGTVFSANVDETRCVHPFEWLPDCAAHPPTWQDIVLSQQMCREDCQECSDGGDGEELEEEDEKEEDDNGGGNGDNNCLCIRICISFPCAPPENNCACNGSNNNNNVQQRPAPPRNEWERPQQPIQPLPIQPWERPAPPQNEWNRQPPQNDWEKRQNEWERRQERPQDDWEQRQNEWEQRQNEWERRQERPQNDWEQRQHEWEQRQERPQWFAAEEVAAKEE